MHAMYAINNARHLWCIAYVLSSYMHTVHDYALLFLRCMLMLWIYDAHSTYYGSIIHAFILSISICDVCPPSKMHDHALDLIAINSIYTAITYWYDSPLWYCTYYRSIIHATNAIDLYAYSCYRSLCILCILLSPWSPCSLTLPTVWSYTSSMYLSVPALVHTLDLQCMLSTLPLWLVQYDARWQPVGASY